MFLCCKIVNFGIFVILNPVMRVHLIAVGGAVMHNLALELKRKGFIVTGSDDEIYEPARSKLAAAGLLPEKEVWFPERINAGIDTIIPGMHARHDNPELAAAKDMGITIKSIPEFFYELTIDKLRIVVGGSYGKTTITAMIMHVMKENGIAFDYLTGSDVDGFENMVRLDENSKIAVIEGDENPSSPDDPRPEFHHYHPHIAVLNGIAWDHIDIYKTFESYRKQFDIFAASIMPGGTLVYFKNDDEATAIAGSCRRDVLRLPYEMHGYFTNKEGCFAATISTTVKVGFFGAHNMQNLGAAREACLAAGITEEAFYNTIGSFRGAQRRLQKMAEDNGRIVYYDFAHSPSMVRATLAAITERYPLKKVIAVFELHTFSSLNVAFLPQYHGTLAGAADAFIYFNPHALAIKRLPVIMKEEIAEAFGISNVKVFNNSHELLDSLYSIEGKDVAFLFMSSGDFNGTDMQLLAEKLVIFR